MFSIYCIRRQSYDKMIISHLAKKCKWRYNFSMNYQLGIFGGRKEVKDNINHIKAPPEIIPPNEKWMKLYELYEEIYKCLGISVLEQREVIRFGDIIAFPEDWQAEKENTGELPLEERIRIHEQVLKELRCRQNT